MFPSELVIARRYLKVLRQMRSRLKGQYDMIILHALTSNHFNESQAMIQDMHRQLFPLLKNKNFIFVVYDLGLSEKERILYEKHCKCQMLTFPFEQLPSYFTTMKCFAWKVFAIAAHYEQADYLMWSDASISLTNPSK